MATCANVLMIFVAAAVLGPATGILISVVTVASGFSGMVEGAAAGSQSIYHSVSCMMLCRYALCKSALNVHGIHGSSLSILYCTSLSCHLNTTLSEL